MSVMIRNTNIELYRLILMMQIFVQHIIGHGLGFVQIGSEQFIYGGGIFLSLVILVICVPSTYAFMFISGYYGINYSHKKLAYMLFSLYSVIIVTGVIKYTIGQPISYWSSLLPITHGPWWFVTWYVVILILAPILNKGIESLTKKQCILIMIAMFTLFCLSITLLSLTGGSNLWGLLCVYLLGRFFKVYNVKLNMNQGLFGYLCGFIIMCSLLFMLLMTGSRYAHFASVLLFNYSNPLIIMMAVCSFFIVLNPKPTRNSVLNKVLQPVLFIYLITESFNPYLYTWLVVTPSTGVLIGIGVIVFALLFGHVVNTLFEKLWSWGFMLIKR